MNREEARRKALKSTWVGVVFVISLICLVLTAVSHLHTETAVAHGSSHPLTGFRSGTLHGPYELQPANYRVTCFSHLKVAVPGRLLVLLEKRKPDQSMDLVEAPRILDEELSVYQDESASYRFTVTKAGTYYVMMGVPYKGGWGSNRVKMERLIWPHPAFFLLGAVAFLLLGFGLVKAQVKLLAGEAF
jgi:hypothetical protein